MTMKVNEEMDAVEADMGDLIESVNDELGKRIANTIDTVASEGPLTGLSVATTVAMSLAMIMLKYSDTEGQALHNIDEMAKFMKEIANMEFERRERKGASIN